MARGEPKADREDAPRHEPDRRPAELAHPERGGVGRRRGSRSRRTPSGSLDADDAGESRSDRRGQRPDHARGTTTPTGHRRPAAVAAARRCGGGGGRRAVGDGTSAARPAAGWRRPTATRLRQPGPASFDEHPLLVGQPHDPPGPRSSRRRHGDAGDHEGPGRAACRRRRARCRPTCRRAPCRRAR